MQPRGRVQARLVPGARSGPSGHKAASATRLRPGDPNPRTFVARRRVECARLPSLPTGTRRQGGAGCRGARKGGRPESPAHPPGPAGSRLGGGAGRWAASGLVRAPGLRARLAPFGLARSFAQYFFLQGMHSFCKYQDGARQLSVRRQLWRDAT